MNVAIRIAACALLACGIARAQAQDLRIANEGQIRDRWMLADGVRLVAPGYPAQFVERGDSVCLAMGYAIQPDGSTSDFSLLRRWSSSAGDAEPVAGFWEAFAQTGANALSQWRFQPRPEVDRPVTTYTVATLLFNGRDAVALDALKQHCRIDDLAAVIREAGKDSGLDWAQRRDMESMRQRASSNRAMSENPSGFSPQP